MVEFLVVFILILLLILIITKYKEHQETYFLKSVAYIIDNGYIHNNQIHVVDLCRFSDSDDMNEAYLFFNILQNQGKIKDSVELIGTNSVGSYRHFENKRKGETEQHNKTTEVAM